MILWVGNDLAWHLSSNHGSENDEYLLKKNIKVNRHQVAKSAFFNFCPDFWSLIYSGSEMSLIRNMFGAAPH